MKKFISTVLLSIFLAIFPLALIFAQVPSEYLPNSHINSAWTSILNTLTELQAYKKTGNDVPSSMFVTLNNNFKTAFKYFPNNPSYNLIYKQCDITTAKLAGAVTYEDYNIFISKCFDPLSNILKDIQSNYTITSSIKATPRNGQVPLSVTFDASTSSDPSKETIPNNNFYRYFTNTEGKEIIIGKGAIINYTFTKAGNYVVHSTVRSLNNLKGYFDADNTIIISAQPTDTKINILANGVKLDENNSTKLSLSEGTEGITLDASSTNIAIGKKIIKHSRSIKSSEGFDKTINNEGVPGSIELQLSQKGLYLISLSTTDNTNSISTKQFQLILSDPVAKIKSTPSAGTTSTNFSFEGDASYSVSSKISLYRRDIYDSESNILNTSQEKNLRYQFKKPGLYTIKLTVSDEKGLSDSSQIKIAVESTAPISQFSITPTSERSDPSEYILDATNSFDYDILNSTDNLTYQRGFSDPDNSEIINQSEDKKQITVQFNQKGNHKVKLMVTDSFGKSSEIIKDIVIKSSLRPIITTDPVAAPRGSKINFTATANKKIISYEWKYGDGESKNSQNNSAMHIYEKVGVYKVSLTVTSSEGEKNTVSSMVYIGENNSPIGVYDVFQGNNQLLLPTETCDGNPAYSIPRYESITIDSSKSVDTKGLRNNVKTLFKPQNDDVYNSSQLRYKFGELGCQWIEMIIEDKEELTADKKKLWFKVKNGLPKMNNLHLSFPQYQNDVGIGLFQYNAPKDPNFEQFDPLVVRVNMENPVDLDGSISYIARYYYKPEDPERLLDIKVTPGNSNAVNFAISREAGEYTFGAKLIDNDGGEVATEDIIGKGPSIFIKPKGNDSVDIPLVTFKTENSNTKIGEEITFTANSRILSNRADFKANRIIKFDFDGDGIDDVTTKDDVVKYIYTKPSPDGKPYKPKVKVIYREKVGVGYAEPIIVKKGIKPNFMVVSFDKKILVRDTTFGYDDKTILEYCLDKNNCEKTTIKGEKTFTYEYDSYGPKTIVLTALDPYGNTIKIEKTIDLKAPAKRLFVELLTAPDNKQTNNGYELNIGKSLENELSLYASYAGSGKCYLDINLSDGDNAKDLECNKLNTITISSISSNVYYKLWYENSKGLTSKIIKVNLIDNQTIVPEQYKQIADTISKMIDSYSNKKDYESLVLILKNLGQNLGDKEKTTEYLIDLQNETEKTQFPKSTLAEIKTITDGLANAGFRATQGLSAYERSKAEIFAYANPALEPKLSFLFDKIENTSDKTDMYTNLSEVLRLYANEVSAGTIDNTDYTAIKTEICKIVNIKEIPGTKCVEGEIKVIESTQDNKTIVTDETQTTSSSSGSSVLSWIIRIIGISIAIFLTLIIIFAVKARMDRAKLAEEKEKEIK